METDRRNRDGRSGDPADTTESTITARCRNRKATSKDTTSQESISDQSLPLTTIESDYTSHEAVGLLTSKTSNYYLVRGRGAWIPVRLFDLYNSDGQKVPKDTKFETIKNSLVRIRYTSGVSKAYIVPKGSEEVQPLFPEDLQRAASSSPPPYRNLLSLTKTISEDVTALCLAQRGNQATVSRLIETARQHMMQKLPCVMEELETCDTRKAQKTLKSMKICMENISLSQARVVCDMCKLGKSGYVISCGHRVCAGCLGPQRTKCGVCSSKFTKVDAKLASVLQK